MDSFARSPFMIPQPFVTGRSRGTATLSKLPANYLCFPSCETRRCFLASKTKSRPARLVLVVTDF